jgi:RNA polymerase-binding transcription factor DksA
VDIPAAPTDPVTLEQLDEPDRLDLDAVERDLHGVEIALERLDDGTYWTDEIDGRPIPDDVLERDPIARRAP